MKNFIRLPLILSLLLFCSTSEGSLSEINTSDDSIENELFTAATECKVRRRPCQFKARPCVRKGRKCRRCPPGPTGPTGPTGPQGTGTTGTAASMSGAGTTFISLTTTSTSPLVAFDTTLTKNKNQTPLLLDPAVVPFSIDGINAVLGDIDLVIDTSRGVLESGVGIRRAGFYAVKIAGSIDNNDPATFALVKDNQILKNTAFDLVPFNFTTSLTIVEVTQEEIDLAGPDGVIFKVANLFNATTLGTPSGQSATAQLDMSLLTDFPRS